MACLRRLSLTMLSYVKIFRLAPKGMMRMSKGMPAGESAGGTNLLRHFDEEKGEAEVFVVGICCEGDAVDG